MRSLLLCALLAACIPDTTGGSSSGSTGTSGGGIVGDASSEGGDATSSVPADREQVCVDYGNATANCCDSTPGACAPNASADSLKKYCEKYALQCPAMPTCFTGGDCNTLIYCTGGC
jgi:hypothetical protein